MKKYITEKNLNAYREHLYEEEKSPATIRKYMCDLRKLSAYLGTQELTKKKMIAYKEMLRSSSQYQLSSINSFLTASNCFFDYMGWYECKVKTFRVQKEVFLPEYKNLTKEEYQKLVQAASQSGRQRLSLILETICATGIRISELAEITVAGAKHGMADIYCKGKARKVLIPKPLQKKLLYYLEKKGYGKGQYSRPQERNP